MSRRELLAAEPDRALPARGRGAAAARACPASARLARAARHRARGPRRRDRPRAPRRLRPRLRLRARRTGCPPTYPHMRRVPAGDADHDRARVPVPACSGSCTSATRSTSTGRSRRTSRSTRARARARTSSRTTAARSSTMAAEARVGRRARVGVAQRLPAPRRRRAPRRARRSGERPAPPPRRRARTGACPATSAAATRAVSGDRNPIHLHPLSARLFGMPRPIAHGMWLKARCLAELEATLPDAFTVDVRFKLPLFLPAQVAFGVARRRRRSRCATRAAASRT